MKILTRMLIAGSIVMLSATDLVPLLPAGVGFIGDAQAIVGAPLTPVSVAGVARRTARRTTVAVASTSAAAASASAASAAASASAAQAAAAKPAPAPAAGALAIGTVVGRLPSGCVSAPVGGVEYYLCNGNYYRAAFQGNEVVYVVQKP